MARADKRSPMGRDRQNVRRWLGPNERFADRWLNLTDRAKCSPAR
jgi:hypothetical protein